MKNLMIDLETMGTSSFAAILSIGAVYFDETGVGDVFYARVRLDSCMSLGMSVDAPTILWWLKQADEARKEFENNGDACLIVDALLKLCAFYKEGVLVWSNGADFDTVILKNAYAVASMNVPWSYKNVRCFRTLKSFFPDIKIDTHGLTSHNALYDAVYQAKYAVEVLKRLKNK